MAVTLGKRKRRGDLGESGSDSSSEEDVRSLFQRAFEAKFKPLKKDERPKGPTAETEAVNLSDELENSDWSGLSDDEEGQGGDIEVVNHDVVQAEDEEARRQEMKAFMSSKPPTSQQKVHISDSRQPKKDAEDDANDSANLKHDLALQRLLKESHLLDPSSYKGTTAAPEGKGRLKALDLRLQDLGAKKTATEQVKMPLAHRKGIVAKAAGREVSRRKEAVENGIILERAKQIAKPEKRRERGIGAPEVGKFRSGTLKLSSNDVKAIQGPKQRTGGKGRRK